MRGTDQSIALTRDRLETNEGSPTIAGREPWSHQVVEPDRCEREHPDYQGDQAGENGAHGGDNVHDRILVPVWDRFHWGVSLRSP